MGDYPKSENECMTATLEALVIQGGINAMPGDGTSIVAQMIWAMAQRAIELEMLLAETREILTDALDEYECENPVTGDEHWSHKAKELVGTID